MNALELKIPPPAVAILIAAAMLAPAYALPSLPLAPALKATLAVLIAVVGAAIDVAGLVAFRRAKTTINPLKPQNSSSLVSGGIYRYTRNPMYVGMLFFLVALAVYLAQPLALLGPLAFALYITRFQIVPEERVLGGLFGEEFAAYKARVRRWL
jgi:protein-S-isoprenylcysteine O-methyltransferase Ste14